MHSGRTDPDLLPPVRGIILCTRPWGLLFASALGDASFSIPAWGMALIGAAGLLLFLLGMKYGDRAEAAILRACGGTATLEPVYRVPPDPIFYFFFIFLFTKAL
ncbi:MAG: hypothetical protein ACLSWS_18395 [Faecalispora jeddahensis]